MTQDQIATYRAALKEARASFDRTTARFHEVTQESSLLMEEIGRLRRTITALAAMCSEDPMIDTLGITESCLEVMEEETGTVTTGQVVNALEGRGFDLASQKNASASVHAVLSRLARRGTIKKVTDEEKKTVYWRGPKFNPSFISDADIP